MNKTIKILSIVVAIIVLASFAKKCEEPERGTREWAEMSNT